MKESHHNLDLRAHICSDGHVPPPNLIFTKFPSSRSQAHMLMRHLLTLTLLPEPPQPLLHPTQKSLNREQLGEAAPGA